MLLQPNHPNHLQDRNIIILICWSSGYVPDMLAPGIIYYSSTYYIVPTIFLCYISLPAPPHHALCTCIPPPPAPYRLHSRLHRAVLQRRDERRASLGLVRWSPQAWTLHRRGPIHRVGWEAKRGKAWYKLVYTCHVVSGNCLHLRPSIHICIWDSKRISACKISHHQVLTMVWRLTAIRYRLNLVKKKVRCAEIRTWFIISGFNL